MRSLIPVSFDNGQENVKTKTHKYFVKLITGTIPKTWQLQKYLYAKYIG